MRGLERFNRLRGLDCVVYVLGVSTDCSSGVF